MDVNGIPESEAEGPVADAYACIRELLGIPFVPTVYRRMAREASVGGWLGLGLAR